MALACIVAGLGGLMAFNEGKTVKRVEGIPVEEYVVLGDVEKVVEGNRLKKQKEKEKEKGNAEL